MDPFTAHNVGSQVSVVGIKRIKMAFKEARTILESGTELDRLFLPFKSDSVTGMYCLSSSIISIIGQHALLCLLMKLQNYMFFR